MTSSELWFNFWIFIILGLPIVYLIYKSNRGQPVLGWSPDTQILVAEGLIYLFIIYIFQAFIFPNSLFFVISAPVWLILFSIIIYMLLAGSDIYVIESTIQNEHFYNLGKVEKLLAPETRQRLLVMDRAVYDQKLHIGDSHYSLWAGSQRIKFTDYYDDVSGTFYHPEIPELHNISFYIQKSFWLKLKEDMPKIMRENVKLTWLSDYKLAHEQIVIREAFKSMLKNLKSQYEHDPFNIGHDIEEIYNKLRKEKVSAPLKTEEAPVLPEQANEDKTSKVSPLPVQEGQK